MTPNGPVDQSYESIIVTFWSEIVTEASFSGNTSCHHISVTNGDFAGVSSVQSFFPSPELLVERFSPARAGTLIPVDDILRAQTSIDVVRDAYVAVR